MNSVNVEPRTAEARKAEPFSRRVRRLAPMILPSAIAILLLIGGLTTSGFATGPNLRSILINASIIGIVAVGMTPVTISGNFVSLATQQTAVLAGILIVLFMSGGVPILLGMLITGVVLGVVGAVTGIIVASGINPIVTTLGVGVVVFGIVNVVVGGDIVYSGALRSSFLGGSWLGLSMPVWGFIVLTIVAQFLVSRTTMGRQFKLLGANEKAARISGVPARRVTILAFTFLGITTALGGMFNAGQLGQSSSTDLSGFMIDVVAAVLVGGTAILGGAGSPLRSAFGALIIASLNNIMLLRDFGYGARLLVGGALIAVVVVILHVARGGSER